MTGSATLLLAAAAGVLVANVYYNQPLLGLMTRAFDGSAVVGFIPTATQLGYALGIVTLVPLGDCLDRRSLIVGQTLVLSLALTLAALAPSAPMLLFASLCVGMTTTVPQQILPMAADLAAPGRRGAVIGTVMGGVMAGIVLARTVSGLIGEAFGWRVVFGVAIALAVATAAGLAATLPSRPPANRLPYGVLLASTFAMVREEPALRAAAATQTCLFASFSVFWTVLALRLEQPPYGLGADAAGLFGIAGAIGVLAAPLSGRVADRFGARVGIWIGIVATFACWLVLGAFTSIPALVGAVMLLDLGVQGAMVANQTIIFGLRPEARNRVNTIYVGTIFVGGALGSASAMVAWRHGGWLPVCGLGGALALLAVLPHMTMARRKTPSPAARG